MFTTTAELENTHEPEAGKRLVVCGRCARVQTMDADSDIDDCVEIDAEFIESVMRCALEGDEDAIAELSDNVRTVSTFTEDGVLTPDRGLVVRLADGREFQVTIMRSH